MYQRTLKNEIEFSGIEPFGGCKVNVRLLPARENTGVVYRIPFKNSTIDVSASLSNSWANKYTLLVGRSVDDGMALIANVEHFNATFFSYALDNVIVELERIPTKSYSLMKKLNLATDIQVVPNLAEREKTLCDLLEKAGIQEQDSYAKLLRVTEPIITEKLSFYPYEGPLSITAITNYPVPGEEKFSTIINGLTFKEELSKSRPLIRYTDILPKPVLNCLGKIFNAQYGIGHGITEETFFYPPKTLDEWRKYEWKEAEIARHTIVDREGAILLLGARLVDTRVITKYSNHLNDWTFLKNNKDRFK